jgi:hypothetical protein
MVGLVKKNYLNITTWRMILTQECTMDRIHLKIDGSASVQLVTLDRLASDLFVKIILATTVELALNFLEVVIFACVHLVNMAIIVNIVGLNGIQ